MSSSGSPDDETVIFTTLWPPDDATFRQRLAWDIAYKGAALGLPRDHPGPQTLEGASSSVAGPHTTDREESPPDSGSDDTESDADTVQSPSSVASTLVDLADLEDTGTKEKAVIHASTRRGATGGRRGLLTLPTNVSLRISQTREEPDSIDFRYCGYYMSLSFSQDVPLSQQEERMADKVFTHHKLLVDSGADTPWLLGYGYQELPGSSDSDWSTEDWSVPGPDRDELQVLALESHEVVLEHGYKLGADGEWKMKEDAVVAKLLYGNNAKAAVTLMEEARSFIIANTYTWPRFEKNTLRVKFTPGVAYAVSKYFDDLPTDGLLGLEPSKYQTVYKGAGGKRVSPISFGYALTQGQALPRPDNGEEGIIYYLGFRRKPWHAFLSYNRWPCVKPAVRGSTVKTFQRSVPTWSADIPVVNGKERWQVRLMVMHFEYRYGEGAARFWERSKSRTYYFGEHGIEVLLDTGTSLSWLPPGLIEHFRLKVFPCPQNTEIHENQGRTSHLLSAAAPYVATVIADDWRVTLGFQGRHGNVVDVTLPINPFLLARPDGAPAAQAAPVSYQGTCCVAASTTYILGLNFFESAFVSLHNPRPDFVGTHTYAKIAPQWPGDVALHQLPGVERSLD
ncbi:hypothetical protein VTO73DRAFT_9995 [Trametes versicolor]